MTGTDRNAVGSALAIPASLVTAPEFRAITVGGKRKGLRLEKVYWDALQRLADKRSAKRSDLIAEVLSDPQLAGINAASALRCFLVSQLQAENDSLSRQLGEINVVGLLQTAPVPAFAIGRDRRLISVNPEFAQVVRVVSGNMSADHKPDASQLTLETPVSQLFAELNSGASSVRCNYLLAVEDRRRRGQAKIVRVPTYATNVLVGYLLG